MANVFAVYYVVAQVIERVVEFFKDASNAYDDVRADMEAKKQEIDDLTKEIERARNAGQPLAQLHKDLNRLLREKYNLDNRMLRDFFIYTSVLGVLAAYLLQLRFLALLGVPADPLLDIGVTGFVVGGGTKPLHDLIKYIEKAKS